MPGYCVKVTGKKAGKKVSKTLKATVTVKNPALTLKAANEVAVGATEQIKATVKPANTKITYTSSDATLATVDEKGVVTGVKAGDVTITVKAGKTTKTVKMTVKDYILKDVKQASTTKLTATVAGNTANLKVSDFVITNTYSTANFAVKSVSVDAKDKTQVTVETYVPMADGKDYTITLGDVTKTITATEGKVAAIAITPSTVTVPTPTNNADGSNANAIVITYTDANGVVIGTTDTVTKTAPSGFVSLDVDVDTTNVGYVSNGVLTLYKAGNVAKVKATLHTGKYDATAKEEGNLVAEATITGVEQTAITTTGWNVKLGKASDTATEFKNVKEAQVAVKDTDAVAYVQRATSDGKTADASDYTFESSNNDVMTVVKGASANSMTKVAINAYKAGNAYIIVKDSKGNVVTTLAVTIGAERKAATLTLDKNAITLSSATGVDTKATVKATVKDQYGADITVASLDYKLASDPDTAYQSVASNTIEIAKPVLKDNKDTSYTYVVKYGDLKTSFVITVRKAEATASTYALELSADSVDAVIKSDAKDATTITAKVCGYDKNGVKVTDGERATFALTKDGKDAKDVAGNNNSATIQINDLTSGKQMAVGTYLVTAKVGDKTFTKTFEVKNSQSSVTVARIKTEGASVAACFEFTYEGKKLTDPDVTFYDLNGNSANEATGTVAVAKATVKIPVGSHYVEQTVAIGLTVTITTK